MKSGSVLGFLLLYCMRVLHGSSFNGSNFPSRLTHDRTDCSKAVTFEAAWWPAAPFVAQGLETDNITGPLAELLQQAVKYCCNEDSTVSFSKRFETGYEMERNWQNETFAVPAVRTIFQHQFDSKRSGFELLPVAESPGAVYFMKNSMAPSQMALTVLVNGWPLLLLVVISAGFAGIVIWLLETYWNPEQFPHPFIRGVWEGFWWALVTMTTVGYGDRAPSSVMGRTFGIIWILVGIIIQSIFTASMTTSLQAGTSHQYNGLGGQQIGVLHGSEELKLVIGEGGSPKVYTNTSSLISAVCNEEIDGGVLEYYAFTVSAASGNRCIRKVATLKNPAMYGVMVQGVGGKHVKNDVGECLVDFIIRRRFSAYSSLLQEVKEFKHHHIDEASEMAYRLFNGVDNNGIYIAIGCLVFAFILGVLWEYLYRRPKQNRKIKESEMSSAQKIDPDTERVAKETGATVQPLTNA